MFATLLIFYINRSESKKVVNGKKDTDFIEVLKMMKLRIEKWDWELLAHPWPLLNAIRDIEMKMIAYTITWNIVKNLIY